MGSGQALWRENWCASGMRPLLNGMRALMDKKRRLMNKIRALMDKNGVVMEQFETFRMWEFIRGCLRQKSAKGKNVPDSSA